MMMLLVVVKRLGWLHFGCCSVQWNRLRMQNVYLVCCYLMVDALGCMVCNQGRSVDILELTLIPVGLKPGLNQTYQMALS